MRDKLIKAGIKNLREFGYPACTAKNITTDRVYRQFFLSMLQDNLGKSAKADPYIRQLIEECQQSTSGDDHG
jgi:hypothetical protein